MEYVKFHDLILPWVGKDTYLLYAPVCRAWAAAYAGAKVTHPRHLFADRATFDRYREDMWDRLSVFAARYADANILTALFPPGPDRELAKEAARAGNKAGVERFKRGNHRDYSLFDLAAEGGHVHIFNLLAFSEVESAMAAAVGRGGSIDGLLWLLQDEINFDIDSPAPGAAEMGHRHVIEWLEEKGYQWRSANVTAAAAAGGQLDLFRWLTAEKDCPVIAVECIEAAVRNGHVKMLEYLRPSPAAAHRITKAAASGGQLELLRGLRARGLLYLDADVMEAAAAGGWFSVVRWLIDEGCPMDWRACAATTSNDRRPRIDILKLLRAEGCPWNDDVCRNATEHRHYQALKWVVMLGAPLSERVMATAIITGSDDKIPKWLLSCGCPIDGRAYDALQIYNGNRLEMVKWIYASIDKSVVVRRHGRADLLEYLIVWTHNASVVEFLILSGHLFRRDRLLNLLGLRDGTAMRNCSKVKTIEFSTWLVENASRIVSTPAGDVYDATLP